MDHDIAPDHAIVIDLDPRVNNGILPYNGIISNVYLGKDLGSIGDDHFLPDIGKCTNKNVLTNPGGGLDIGRLLNACKLAGLYLLVFFQQGGKSAVSVGHLIRVASIGCFNSWPSLTMMTEALVLYKCSSYFGFARKESWPVTASSILPKDPTMASALPSTLPSTIIAICAAENCIIQGYLK
jgi:hypothetical protein